MALLAVLALAVPATAHGTGAEGAGAGAGAPPSGRDSDALRALVERRLDENRVRAAAVVVREDGETAWAFTRGVDVAGDPISLRTPFGIGSISKGLTGLLAASLAREGRLDLDAPVEAVLPELRSPATPASHAAVTLRDLVHHRSGLDVRGERLFVDEPPIERARAVWERPLVRAPGESFEYVNTNYLILGLALERATGRPLAELLEDRVLEPLRTPGEEAPAGAAPAPAHQLWFGWPVRHAEPPRESLASGGVFASAEQLARLVDALGSGGRIGGREAFDPRTVHLATSAGIAAGEDSGYAMGWYRRPIAGKPTISHGGSTPGYSAFALHQEGAGRTIVVLTASWGAIWGSHTPIWIAADLVHLLEGEPVPERTGAAVGYRWLQAAIAVSLLLTGRSVRRMLRRPAELRELPPGARRRRALAAAGRHLAVAAALAFLVPLWARFSLRSFVAVPSDVGVLLLFGIGSGVLFGLAELVAWRRAAADRAAADPTGGADLRTVPAP